MTIIKTNVRLSLSKTELVEDQSYFLTKRKDSNLYINVIITAWEFFYLKP